MKRAGRGVIVLTASGAGVTGGSASIPYAPSKGGVHGLTMVLAMHLARYGIRVNEVCPGKIDTPLVAKGREEVFRHTGRRPAPPAPDGGGSPFLFEGNLGAPEGVAEVYAFLASDQADYVRGAIFTR
jgi:3-oxoacyl-[acyl-carrier protein] reductase